MRQVNDNNFLRQSDFDFVKDICLKTKLNYKTHELRIGEDICDEYEIPESDIQTVLSLVNPINECLPIFSEQEMLCFTTGKTFKAKEFKVIWHREYQINYLVTPWFASTGGTFTTCIRKI